MSARWQEHESVLAGIDPNKAKADRLRKDAKLLDTGMDPELVRELHAEADALDPPFDPAKVLISHFRFSTTQGEVEVRYNHKLIERYGDTITLQEDGSYAGLPDSVWIEAARKAMQQ